MEPLRYFIFEYKISQLIAAYQQPKPTDLMPLYCISLTHLVEHSVAVLNKSGEMLSVEIHQVIFQLLVQETLTVTAYCLGVCCC